MKILSKNEDITITKQERGHDVIIVGKPKYYKKWLLLLGTNNLRKLSNDSTKKHKEYYG